MPSSFKNSKATLIARIEALKLRNKRLESRIATLEDKFEKQSKVSQALNKSRKYVSLERYEDYFRYKYNMIKSTDLWDSAGRIIAYSRRSLFIARLFRYSSMIVAFIETSAVLVITASVLLFLLPVTLALAIILMTVDSINAKKSNLAIFEKAQNKTILFFVAQDGYRANRNSYFDVMVRDFSMSEKYFVIVISKSLRDGLFITSQTAGNLTIIRETYFFRLKRYLNKMKFDKKKMYIIH